MKIRISQNKNNDKNLLAKAFLLLTKPELDGLSCLKQFAACLCMISLLTLLAGCGGGGYAGQGVVGLSRSAATIDAGQSLAVTASLSGAANVTWSVAGNGCSGSACGTVVTNGQAAATYTAPSTAAPMNVTLTASVAGTTNLKVVNITVNPDPAIAATLPTGIVGTPYQGSLLASGGTAVLGPISIAAGALPAGVTFNPTNGSLSGTPTTAGTFAFSAQLTDASAVPYVLTTPESITISAPVGPSLTLSGNPPAGTVGVAYTTSFTAAGGVGPYSFSLIAGSLPAGLTLSASTGVLSGTPLVSGNSLITVQVQDASSNKASKSVTVTINGAAPSPLILTVGALPNGVVGTPYSATLGVAGGNAPYSCSVTSGSWPAGLNLGSGCVLAGTPTAAGTSALTVQTTDSGSPAQTATGPETITIAAAPVTLTLNSPPNATVGVPYAGSIGVSGGTGPYACTLTVGTLPPGLSLSANCAVTGTPTLAGSTPVTVNATDASNPPASSTGGVTFVVLPAPLTLAVTSLPNGTVGTPYNAVIGVNGGSSPYSCTLVSGNLPAGLSLGAGCVVSGTPTVADTANLDVKVIDSGNPSQTTSGRVGITILPAALTLSTANLPNGTVGTSYSAAIAVNGGTSPYSCTLVSGTLPAGLALGAGCVVSGTPTVAGTANLNVMATDSAAPAQTVTGPVSITISPATLILSVTALPNGTVGIPYSTTIGVSGGTAPYSCSVTGGTLPAGLTLSGACLVSGTPTVAGTAQLTVNATDSGSPAQSKSGPQTIVISAAAPTLTLAAPPAATVNVPYSHTIPVTGGTGPYTCTIAPGTLPNGLSLGANCLVTGTPTSAGSTQVNVTATDSSNPQGTITAPVTLTVNAPTAVLTLTSPPNATVGSPYSGTIGVTGGTAPYACSIVTGTLPTGLSLNAGCAVTGTPTISGSTGLTVTATDSASPQGTVTGPVTVTVLPVPPLTFTGSLPNATLNQPYTQTLAAAGGIGPYSYTVTAGNLPAGMSLSTSGVLTGTPTDVGASSFTVTAKDSEAVPQTASLPLVLLVVYPTSSNDADLHGPYAFLFQGYDDVAAGVLAYQTATVGSFTADGTGVIAAGESDSNSQAFNPGGNTVSSNDFVGTYTIGTDLRGLMTLTRLNSDGTTGRTSTYAIALKAPVSPATNSVRAQMIEFDNDHLQGTKGSGTILAQTASAFSSPLNGNYAFGISGDTPCLPSCTVGIIAGPAAAVGQFTAGGSGALTSGTSDASVASTYFSSQPLSGTYGSADGNGRLALSMTTAGMPTPYPNDYAVYMIDANNAFLMSTDKHSAYILLAGTAQRQTLSPFSNASMSGAYVGYENSPTNPGLVGSTLSNTLNLSTATIFRGTAAGAGVCNTTNVDQGGVTALVNGLTGLGSGSNIINALLGTYASTGNSACTVAANGRGMLAYPAPNGLLATTLALLGLGNDPPPARVFYLVSADKGYFLETGYAGLGHMEPQLGAPFTLASLNGTYVYASSPASSLVSINTSGVVVADGAGHDTTTLDSNVGVGTVNILQLGVGSSGTYALQDAAAGRYVSGTYVLYAVSPTEFVLIDENPLTTSPSVAVLY